MIIAINKEYSKMARLARRFMVLRRKNQQQYGQSHNSEVSQASRVIKREMTDVSQML
jgi:hypothetical protein